MESVIAQLNKIDTSLVITAEVSGGELLVTTKPTPPAMVNSLIKVRIPSHISSAVVVDKFNEMMKG